MSTPLSQKYQTSNIKRRRITPLVAVTALLAALLSTAVAPPASSDPITGPNRVDGAPNAPSLVTASTTNYTSMTVGFVPDNFPGALPTKFFVTVTTPSQPSTVIEVRHIGGTAGWESFSTTGGGRLAYDVCEYDPATDPTSDEPTYCELTGVAGMSGPGEYSATVTAIKGTLASPETYSNILINAPPSTTPTIAEISTSTNSLLIEYTPAASQTDRGAVGSHGVIVSRPVGSTRTFKVATAGVVTETTTGTSVALPSASVICSATCTLSLPLATAAGTYSVSMYATNTAGNGPSTAADTESQGVVGGPTGSVTGMATGVSNTSATVSFDLVGDQPGDLVIDRYDIILSSNVSIPVAVQLKRSVSGSTVNWTGYTAAGGSLIGGYSASCVAGRCTVVFPIVKSGDYKFAVLAGNSAGNGPVKEEPLTVPRPASVTGLGMAADGVKANVNFILNTPALETGPTPTSYTLVFHTPVGPPTVYQIRQISTGDWRPYLGGSTSPVSGSTNLCPASPSPVACSLNVAGGFTAPGDYWVEMAAASAFGNSSPSVTNIIRFGGEIQTGPQLPPVPTIDSFTTTDPAGVRLQFTQTTSPGVSTDSYNLILKSPNTFDKVYRIYKQNNVWAIELTANTPPAAPGVVCTESSCVVTIPSVLQAEGTYTAELMAANYTGNSASAFETFENTVPAAPVFSSAPLFTGKNLTAS